MFHPRLEDGPKHSVAMQPPYDISYNGMQERELLLSVLMHPHKMNPFPLVKQDLLQIWSYQFSLHDYRNHLHNGENFGLEKLKNHSHSIEYSAGLNWLLSFKINCLFKC